MSHNTFTALFLSLFLAGCSGASVFSSADDDSRWGDYRTFGFVQSGGANSRVESILQAEVTRQLNARGMTRSTSPDILVNIAAYTEKLPKTRISRTTGFAAARYPFLQEYYRDLGEKHLTDIDEQTEGRLTIDVLDVRQREMVWRGRTRGRITPAMMADPQAALASAVNEVFQKFPKAGG
ncbi:MULTISPECIES: DUF4136 domain-containing protein [Microbulbifer]|uniref:DUF4136 domain-containing protein n=1 Tax=Microbulbifer TaxID=48073 RepID=UPI001E32AB3F|nr:MULTISPECIES: DUF4136 domain-containing protein [Microbulbifer]UHQ55239.1 DUF4136 domain-containing protein [Microbulbifer sp. YPW16]